MLNERGSLFALAHDLEAQAAAAVCERMPVVELVRFGNSGTECVQYALRFARAFTGRQLVVRFEGHYHGWSDVIHWSAHPSPETWGPPDHPAVTPETTGMTPGPGDSLIVLRLERRRRPRAVFADHGERIAAVITEPIVGNSGAIMPAPGYLERMRSIASDAGALLIFDEVLTGFRVHRAAPRASSASPPT